MDKQTKYGIGFITIWAMAAIFCLAFWAAVFVAVLKIIAWL